MGLKLTKNESPLVEIDMTPMIDVTFQLIAFFMMLINFSQAETDKRIHLPTSELAIPAEETEDENFVTLHVDDKDGRIIMSAEVYTIAELPGALARRKNELQNDKHDISQTRIIVRADTNAETGLVQEVIAACQEAKFEKFKLRAEQDLTNRR